MHGQTKNNVHPVRRPPSARAGALSANDPYASSGARSGTHKAAAVPTLRFSVAERFQTALFVSALLHAALLLGLKFQVPKYDPKLASTLNVVLVNSKSQTRPDDAQALAQANLDGGGNTDEKRMAKSPLPAQGRDSPRTAPLPRKVQPQRRIPKASESERVAAPVQAPVAAPQPQPVAEPPAEPAPMPTPAAAPQESVVATSPATETLPPELQALAEQEAAARERVAALEREARELMTQLRSERQIEQPSTSFTVPPEYRPRPSNDAPRPAVQPQDRAWPPSPPPVTTTSSSNAARVVKVEPQERTLHNQPSIKAPPKEELRAPSAAQPPVAQVRANAGLRTNARSEPEAEPAPTPTPSATVAPSQPTPQARPLYTAQPSEPPKSQAVPAPAATPEERVQPEATVPSPTQSEVKIVKVEPQAAPIAQPQLRPQQAPTPVQVEMAPEQAPATVTAAAPTQSEMLRNSSELARLEAQIEKDYDEYQKRPRRKFIGARTTEFRYANYIEQWRTKVERVGNTNYPEAARQKKIEGRLQLTVAIKADGTIESVELNRSSGHKVLDAAALRILELAAPFARFPPEVSKDTDILHITRTWTFSREGLMSE